jgi:hypothetical protein
MDGLTANRHITRLTRALSQSTATRTLIRSRPSTYWHPRGLESPASASPVLQAVCIAVPPTVPLLAVAHVVLVRQTAGALRDRQAKAGAKSQARAQ